MAPHLHKVALPCSKSTTAPLLCMYATSLHIALITAQSYAKEKAEAYYTTSKTNHQIIREYIDLFGFMSKNPNAMDIMIEEAKCILRTWNAAEPNFLLTNSKLTFQMTMIPEKTQYLTQGPDGVRRLRQGPDIASYRGLRIINTRSFSMEVRRMIELSFNLATHVCTDVVLAQ